MLNVDYSVLVTVLYVIILYVFLNQFFFRPVLRILSTRRELTEGRLEESRRRLEMVERKTADYEHAMRSARSDAYHQQEIERERALADKSSLVLKAKAESDKAVQEGRARLKAEAEAARAKMAADVDNLAKKLATTILQE